MMLARARPRNPCVTYRTGAGSQCRTEVPHLSGSDHPNPRNPITTARKVRPRPRGQSVGSLGSLFAVPKTLVETLEKLFGGFCDHGAWWENRFSTGLHQRVVILRRHHATNHNHDVVAALFGEFYLQFRHQREVSRGKRGHTE